MITDALISVLSAVPLALLSLLPNVNIAIPDGVFNWLLNVCSAIGYFLPVKALLPILGIMFSVTGFKIAWSIVLRVKSFIPTMGS